MLAGGSAAGQAIVLAISPVVTRLYTPDDFGFLSLYTSTLAILVVVVSLRYHLAIPLPEADADARALLIASAIAALLVTGTVAIVLVVAGDYLLARMGAASLAAHTWLLPVGLLGAGAYQILSGYAIRLGAYRPLAITKVTQGAALATAQVGLGLLGAGPVGLMLGDAIGKTAGSGQLARLLRAQAGVGPTAEAWRRLGAVVRRYRRFPLLSSGSALLNSLGLALPALVLLSAYGPEVAGWYALAMRAVGAPLMLLGNAISQVYTSTAARQLREHTAGIGVLYARTARQLATIAVPAALLLFWIGPEAFALVFSEAWRPAGEFGRVLAPMLALQTIAAPLSQTLNLLERHRSQLVWDALRLAAVVGVLTWAVMTERSATTALTALSASLSLAYVALFVLGWAAARRRDEEP